MKAGEIQASLVRQLPSSVLWEDSVGPWQPWVSRRSSKSAGDCLERIDPTDRLSGDHDCERSKVVGDDSGRIGLVGTKECACHWRGESRL